MNRQAIIGIGNPNRSDDAIGWHAIDLLKKNPPAHTDLVKASGEMTELLELFSQYDTIHCIDAASGLKMPWMRFETLEELAKNTTAQTSTHGLGLLEAIKMAKTLETLPKTLIIWAIRAGNYKMGQPVATGCNEAIQTVVNSILTLAESV